jgi:hypothetical protein
MRCFTLSALSFCLLASTLYSQDDDQGPWRRDSNRYELPKTFWIQVESVDSRSVQIAKTSLVSAFYQIELYDRYKILADVVPMSTDFGETVLKLSNIRYVFSPGGEEYPLRFYRETSTDIPGWDRERVAGSICRAIGYKDTSIINFETGLEFDPNAVKVSEESYENPEKFQNAKTSVVLHDDLSFNKFQRAGSLSWISPIQSRYGALDDRLARNLKAVICYK